jgi:hypothetical protein
MTADLSKFVAGLAVGLAFVVSPWLAAFVACVAWVLRGAI